MSEYVWSTQDFLFANGIFEARLLPGQVWWADDPLVKARPEFFSATPPTVLSTVGRPQPGLTPVVSAMAEPVASAPVVDDAQKAVDAINQPRTRSRRG